MAWTPFTRDDHDRSGLRYASDTTDEEWALIAPFMPPQPARGRRRRTDLRAVIDGIFYLLQSSCQWALLLKDFPPKSTVHHYFKRFSGDGTWARIHDALYCKTRDLEGREESPSYAIIDSQSVKTGAEARRQVGFDAGKKVKGCAAASAAPSATSSSIPWASFSKPRCTRPASRIATARPWSSTS